MLDEVTCVNGVRAVGRLILQWCRVSCLIVELHRRVTSVQSGRTEMQNHIILGKEFFLQEMDGESML